MSMRVSEIETIDELRAILALMQEQDWATHDLVEAFHDDKHLIMVGKVGDKIVGAVTVEFYDITEPEQHPGTYACITDLYVKRRARKRGYGATLVTVVHEQLKDVDDLVSCRIHVRANNPDLVRFYEKLGYKKLVLLLGYHDLDDHVWYMEREFK